MKTELRIPEISKNPAAEIVVSTWYKKPGDRVVADEPIAELLFDKAAFDFCAPCSGDLLEISMPEEAKGCVGSLLAIMETES
ncbi:MAG: lipoyl domain-containing protein [Candidatus Brocadiia bacterium]